MSDYVFDSTSIDFLSLFNDDYDKEDRLDIVAEQASEQQRVAMKDREDVCALILASNTVLLSVQGSETV
ncbi:unnamed protein product [Rotaria sp. Silwood2]|nr:unnamed protein product [Rotaria sp. Silwood2]